MRGEGTYVDVRRGRPTDVSLTVIGGIQELCLLGTGAEPYAGTYYNRVNGVKTGLGERREIRYRVFFLFFFICLNN